MTACQRVPNLLSYLRKLHRMPMAFSQLAHSAFQAECVETGTPDSTINITI